MRISDFTSVGVAMITAVFVVIVLSVHTGLALSKPKKDKAEITVSLEDCRRLIAHRPSADVNYKPGVDVRGRQVARVDFPGSQVIKSPDKITFNITYDVLGKFGLSGVGSSFFGGDAVVGAITYEIYKGRLEFNGRPLTDTEIAILAVACKKARE